MHEEYYENELSEAVLANDPYELRMIQATGNWAIFTNYLEPDDDSKRIYLVVEKWNKDDVTNEDKFFDRTHEFIKEDTNSYYHFY